MIRFPQTGLDDAGHVAFAARFGELDDVSPYTKLGKKHRLAFEQLFDVSNLLDDGSIAPVDSHRTAMNKVYHVTSVLSVPAHVSMHRETIYSTLTAPSIRGEPDTAY